MATDEIVGVLLDFGSSSHRFAGCRASRRHVGARLSRPRVARGLAQFNTQWELSLAGHWPLDEAFGTRYDVLGAMPLTDHGGVGWEPGKIGNAATFESSLIQYLQGDSNSNLQLGGGSFTIALWVKLSTTTGNRPFIWKYDEPSGQREYALGYESGRVVLRVYPDGSLGSLQQLTTSGSLTASTWYFVVAGYNASTTSLFIRVYQPGYSELAAGGAASAMVTGGAYSGTAPFRVGYGNLPGYIFAGSMDSIWIWKRTLSLDEEVTLFNQGTGYEPVLSIPRFRSGKYRQGWRDGWRGHHGRVFRAPVPNQGQADPAHVLHSRLIHPAQPAPCAGRVFRLTNHANAGEPAAVAPRHRQSGLGPPHLSPQGVRRGSIRRGPVPFGEFLLHAGRSVQGWRRGVPPQGGRCNRSRVPGVRGLELFPPRVARGHHGNAEPYGARSHRAVVPGSGLSGSPIAAARHARPPFFRPWGGHNHRGVPPAEVGSVQYDWLTDEGGESVVDENGNVIVLRDGLGKSAAQVVLGHRIANSHRHRPASGAVFRRPVPPSGRTQAPVVRPHSYVRSAQPPPHSGAVYRQPVPRQSLVDLPVVSSRVASAPRPVLRVLRGRVYRSGCRRIPVLSNTGQVIGGRYYVTAGQIYVAGAVAGQVVVE